jgi:hypothetical protein
MNLYPSPCRRPNADITIPMEFRKDRAQLLSSAATI